MSNKTQERLGDMIDKQIKLFKFLNFVCASVYRFHCIIGPKA